jgi:hypothetical protein
MGPFDALKIKLDLWRSSPHLADAASLHQWRGEPLLKSKPQHTVLPFDLFKFDLQEPALEFPKGYVCNGVVG